MPSSGGKLHNFDNFFLLSILRLLLVFLVVLHQKMSWSVGMLNLVMFLATGECGGWWSLDHQDSIGRQRSVQRIHVIVFRQLILADEMTCN